MKIRILVSLLVLTLSYFLFSCKEGGGARRSALPPVSGSTNELLVVMPKTLWEGHVGDTIKEFSDSLNWAYLRANRSLI